MVTMVIFATVASVLPILVALTMPDWYLGDMQNAVDDSVEPDEDDNEN
jgi:hypothetical protein